MHKKIRLIATVTASLLVILLVPVVHAAENTGRPKALEENPAGLNDTMIGFYREASRIYRDAGQATSDLQPTRRECLSKYARYFECVAAQNPGFDCKRPRRHSCTTNEGTKTDVHAIAQEKYERYNRMKAARIQASETDRGDCYMAKADYHRCRAQAHQAGTSHSCDEPPRNQCRNVR